LIEVKLSEDQFDPSLKYFSQFFPQNTLKVLQIVKHSKQPKEVFGGPKMVNAASWLGTMPG
jgi:hypothetical protein